MDSPKKSAELKAKLKLEFPVLSDDRGKVARRWGVLDEKTEISKPATFLIKKGGRIVFKLVGKNPSDLPHADKLLELAKSAGKDADTP